MVFGEIVFLFFHRVGFSHFVFRSLGLFHNVGHARMPPVKRLLLMADRDVMTQLPKRLCHFCNVRLIYGHIFRYSQMRQARNQEDDSPPLRRVFTASECLIPSWGFGLISTIMCFSHLKEKKKTFAFRSEAVTSKL